MIELVESSKNKVAKKLKTRPTLILPLENLVMVEDLEHDLEEKEKELKKKEQELKEKVKEIARLRKLLNVKEREK